MDHFSGQMAASFKLIASSVDMYQGHIVLQTGDAAVY